MLVKLIVRLLTHDGTLLGWTTTQGSVKGDRCIRPTSAIVVAPCAAGVCETVSVHWPDMHVQKVSAFQQSVEVGKVVTLQWEGPIFEFGSDEGPLPAVTVGGSPVIVVPTGTLGATGS